MLKAKSAALDESIKLNICSLTIHQENLLKENASLLVTVNKLKRDVAKSHSSDVGISYHDEHVTDASRPRISQSLLFASQTSSPWLTPPETPPTLSASALPTRTPPPVSPRRHSNRVGGLCGINEGSSATRDESEILTDYLMKGEIRGCESKKKRKDQDRASSSDRDRGHVYDRDRDREGDRVREYVRKSRDRVRHQDYKDECWSNLDGLWVRVNNMWVMGSGMALV
nr:hypothetical protein CTI12_AA501740 [Tanacetum cinerariifolium]